MAYRRCGFRYEKKLRITGISSIAGIDEAGRGALAGPVVAAAAILPEKFRHRRLNDSKQLASELREDEVIPSPTVGARRTGHAAPQIHPRGGRCEWRAGRRRRRVSHLP